MELYTLDGLLRRTELIEGYESFIWAERYATLGELEIVAPATQQFRNLLPTGTGIGHSESKRVMVVDTVEDVEDDEGVRKLKIRATELTEVLKHRVAKTGVVGSKANTWASYGSPHAVVNQMFQYVCLSGTNPTDTLDLLVSGSLYAAGNLPTDQDSYNFERPIGDLYGAIKEICDIWDLGFRMYKGDDTAKLYFDVYKGHDRTTSQTIFPAVIFSPELDSLQGVSELVSTSGFKNVAQVTNELATFFVYAEGASVETRSYAKRVLFVDASDIKYAARTNVLSVAQEQAINKAIGLKDSLDKHKEELQKLINKERLTLEESEDIPAWTAVLVGAGLITVAEQTAINSAVNASVALNAAESAALTLLMKQRGEQELAKNRPISAFDGEITQLSPYKYNRDYHMGDLVEMRNSAGLTNQMLVTEQIFSADGTGERAYPMLTMKQFITPGSWLAWENSQVWQVAPGTWATS